MITLKSTFHHHDSFSTMHCGDRFQVSRKGGTGGGDIRDVCMVVIAAGYRKALVGTGWAISLLCMSAENTHFTL